MSGPEGVKDRQTSALLGFYDKPLPKEEERARVNVANAPWALDVEKLGNTAPIPAAVFTNPAMLGPTVRLASPTKPAPSAASTTPKPATAPTPPAAAPDAYKGIKLVVNENGTVRFLDGQAGGVANLEAGYVDFFLLRTN